MVFNLDDISKSIDVVTAKIQNLVDTKRKDLDFGTLDFRWKGEKVKLKVDSNRIIHFYKMTNTMLDEGPAINSILDKNIVAFSREQNLPQSTVTTYDISANKDGSIVTWVDNLNSEKVMYYYSDADEIVMNPESSTLFSRCTKLVSLDISNWNSSKVTNMYEVFNECAKLTSLDLSHFDTSKVTDMQYMFNGCSALSSLFVDHFRFVNTSLTGLSASDNTNMTYYMFNGCAISEKPNWQDGGSWNSEGTYIRP